jgi:cytoskeletal protein RodZ
LQHRCPFPATATTTAATATTATPAATAAATANTGSSCLLKVERSVDAKLLQLLQQSVDPLRLPFKFELRLLGYIAKQA